MESTIIELLNSDVSHKSKKIVSEYLSNPMDFKSDFFMQNLNQQLEVLSVAEEGLVRQKITIPGLHEMVKKLKTLEDQEIILFYATNVTTRQRFSIILDEKAIDIYGLIEYYNPPPVPKWAHLCNPQ
jgi:hypothetical protein